MNALGDELPLDVFGENLQALLRHPNRVCLGRLDALNDGEVIVKVEIGDVLNADFDKIASALSVSVLTFVLVMAIREFFFPGIAVGIES